MSWNLCSITGEQLQTPVLSRKTGHMFEKRIVEQYVNATGLCPITQQPLALEDLIPVVSKLNTLRRAISTQPTPRQCRGPANRRAFQT